MKTVVSATTNSAATVAATSNATASSVTVTPASAGLKSDLSDSTSSLPFSNPNSSLPGGNTNKRPASLDLNKQVKKTRMVGPSPLAIDPPELPSIKSLNTPDLEKIILSSNLLQTPQPGLVFPSKVGAVTSEQEAFGKGFEEALHSLHNSKNSQSQLTSNSVVAAPTATAAPATVTTVVTGGVTTGPTTTSAAVTGMSGGSFTYTNMESSYPVAIKDEPQNPPSSPPVSPIDMETQEKIKLERKRQRNRVAASKCRKRKLERISKLEEKVKILKGENTDLGLVVKNLKDHVAQLKQQVIDHMESGCSIPPIYNGNSALQSK